MNRRGQAALKPQRLAGCGLTDSSSVYPMLLITQAGIHKMPACSFVQAGLKIHGSGLTCPDKSTVPTKVQFHDSQLPH